MSLIRNAELVDEIAKIYFASVCGYEFTGQDVEVEWKKPGNKIAREDSRKFAEKLLSMGYIKL